MVSDDEVATARDEVPTLSEEDDPDWSMSDEDLSNMEDIQTVGEETNTLDVVQQPAPAATMARGDAIDPGYRSKPDSIIEVVSKSNECLDRNRTHDVITGNIELDPSCIAPLIDTTSHPRSLGINKPVSIRCSPRLCKKSATRGHIVVKKSSANRKMLSTATQAQKSVPCTLTTSRSMAVEPANTPPKHATNCEEKLGHKLSKGSSAKDGVLDRKIEEQGLVDMA